MKIIATKRTLTLFVSLLLLTSLLVFSFFKADAAIKDGQQFGDWAASCKENKDKKSTCHLFQSLEASDESKRKIASFKIGYFGSDSLKIVEILPFGTNLQSGTAIISDDQNDKLLAKGQFVTCHEYGCVAHAELSEEDLNVILNATTNYVRIMSMEGKLINIPLSNKGLAEAIQSLKK